MSANFESIILSQGEKYTANENFSNWQHFYKMIAEKAWQDLHRSDLVCSRRLGQCPEIVFSDMDDDIPGVAHKHYIELNQKYLNDTQREILIKTLLHNIIHIAEYRISGIMGHGPLWKVLLPSENSEKFLSQDIETNKNENDVLFALLALISLAGALFFFMYVSFHYFGVRNIFLSGAIGITGIVLSVVLWAALCQTFEQLKTAVCIQALLSVIFVLTVFF